MDDALARIRSFSMVTWTVGTIVVMILAFVTIPPILSDPRTGALLVGAGGDRYDIERPWLAAHPQEYTIEDGVVHGTRAGGFLRLPGGSAVLMLTPRQDVDDGPAVHQQVGVQLDTDADDWAYPGYIGSLWGPSSPVLVMPADVDGLLWFSPSMTDWTIAVSEPEAQPMGESATGSGNAVLIYDGAALSGRFQHTGSGLLQVALVGVGEWESIVNDFDEVDLRASWDPSDRIAFFVESDTGAGTWTITLDSPASDPVSPSPTPEESP